MCVAAYICERLCRCVGACIYLSTWSLRLPQCWSSLRDWWYRRHVTCALKSEWGSAFLIFFRNGEKKEGGGGRTYSTGAAVSLRESKDKLELWLLYFIFESLRGIEITLFRREYQRDWRWERTEGEWWRNTEWVSWQSGRKKEVQSDHNRSPKPQQSSPPLWSHSCAVYLAGGSYTYYSHNLNSSCVHVSALRPTHASKISFSNSLWHICGISQKTYSSIASPKAFLKFLFAFLSSDCRARDVYSASWVPRIIIMLLDHWEC